MPSPSAEHRDKAANTRAYGRKLPKQIKLGTFNARTLKDAWRLTELCWLAAQLGIAVLAVQEHRRANEESAEPGLGWQFKAAPASPQGVGGIAFLLSPAAGAALLDLEFISDRVARATFALADRRLHFICAYAPTAPQTVANKEATTAFYDSIRRLLDSIPNRDFFLVAGDFNAPLVPDGTLVRNRCGSANANSPLLHELLRSRDLAAVNGLLRQRYRKLPTFFGTRGRVTRLDWLLCSRSHINKVRRVANVRPDCILSDHSLLACEVNLRWHTFKKQPPFPLWADLRNPDTRAKFIRRIFESGKNPADSAESFASAVETAAEILPKRTPHLPKAVWDADPPHRKGQARCSERHR